MIKISNLSKTFNPGTPNQVKALSNIDLEVGSGEFITIIGTNGSGKSTLLNAISGSFLPDEGSMEIDGKVVTNQTEYQRARVIARVFQNPFAGTAPDMTISQNLHMAAMREHMRLPRIRLNSKTRQSYKERVKVLEMQLENRLDNNIGSLSGGQRQALTLLMSVIAGPKVLLLDEHTAALDPKSAAQVISLTKMFIEKGNLTTLMITHSMQQALDLGTRTLMMHQGRIIEDLDQTDKQRLSVEDLLGKFADIRKAEQLTDEIRNDLKNQYL